ncbi:hypothetical protein CRM22_006236 [Opisthorchis felineus]|uniref:Alpha-ketoglutarate-dependent dioxygenase AlkB-like domain-containing protein n=1 Tax=Opisthorchis felineus TaxID=147828 RepID=A0A4S2LU93_OPIFE|nr:hypothetical protein CRM22_006236 [Opisthorchis felineus]
MLADLSQYTVANFPSRLYYIPDFLSETEEQDLCDFIYASPIPKWVTLSGRRLQNWGGIPHPKGMLSEPIPPWLTKFVDRVSALGVFGSNCANHVLVNEYKPGQGISPHHDGPLYFPVVATLNLGSYGILDFYRPLDDNDMNEVCLCSSCPYFTGFPVDFLRQPVHWFRTFATSKFEFGDGQVVHSLHARY